MPLPAAAALALALQAQPVPPYTVAGRCEYPPDLAVAEPLAIAHECRQVEVGEDRVAFSRGPDAPVITFRGRRAGGTPRPGQVVLRVEEIVLRDGAVHPADGECRHVRPPGPTTSVLCTGIARGRLYIANLVHRSTRAR